MHLQSGEPCRGTRGHSRLYFPKGSQNSKWRACSVSCLPWHWTSWRCRWSPPPCRTQSLPIWWYRTLSHSGRSRRSWCTSVGRWRSRSRAGKLRQRGRRWWPWRRWWRSASRTGWWQPCSWWASCRLESPGGPSGKRPMPRPKTRGRLQLWNLQRWTGRHLVRSHPLEISRVELGLGKGLALALTSAKPECPWISAGLHTQVGF